MLPSASTPPAGSGTEVQYRDGPSLGAVTGSSVSGGSVTWGATQNVTGGSVFVSGAYSEASSTAGVYVGIASGSARMMFVTGGVNWQIDNNGGPFRWFTPGVVRMSLDTSNVLSVASGGGTVEVSAVRIPQRAGDPSAVSNGVNVYAKDVAGTAEAFVQDEAGNVTQFSPHAMDGPASLYDAADVIPHVVKEHNAHLGQVRYVNLSRTAFLLEELLKAIAQGRTLAQIATFLNARGPGFIDVYRVETFPAHNARLGLSGPAALTQVGWAADQVRRQAVYDAARADELADRDRWDAGRAAELAARAAWDALPPEQRVGERPIVRDLAFRPPVRDARDIRKPVPQWLADRGVS